MQYTTLGNTGLVVSRLAFGAMTFGSDPAMESVYKVDRETAQAMVERALAAGINFFDCLPMAMLAASRRPCWGRFWASNGRLW